MLKLVEELCTGCGICEDICSFGAITISNERPIIGDECTLCGACVDECPVSALEIEKQEHKKEDLSQFKGVWVFAENRYGILLPVVNELLGSAISLAKDTKSKVSAVLLCEKAEKMVEELWEHGADQVYLLEDKELINCSDVTIARIISDLVKDKKPEIFMAGASSTGRSMMPRLAARLKTGLTADCTSLSIGIEDNCLYQTRPAFGGNIMATIICPDSRPQMATVRSRVMKKAKRVTGKKGELNIIEKKSAWFNSGITFISFLETEIEKARVGEVDIVISGGRGMESPDNFALLHELADLMGGAVGASRGAVDDGWITYPHQVGQTGCTVAPKVYIACGISGAVQHLVGMQGSETIIAINCDEHAPIFNIADIGIVGNCMEIIPLLINRLK